MDINYNHVIGDIQSKDIIVSGGCGNLLVSGILKGTVIVIGPAAYKLTGIMNGDLQVRDGGSTQIYGTLNANTIQCLDGALEIFGIVNCNTGIPENAILHTGCIVNGTKH